MTDSGETAQSPSASGTTKVPGWYPDRTNPNVQNYWDGQAWSAQRRWMQGRWFDVEMGPAAGDVPLAAPGTAPGVGAAVPAPRPSPQSGANPYLNLPPHLYTQASPGGRTTSSTNTISLAMLGLLVCSVIIIIGSFTPWITISLGDFSTSFNGTHSGVFGEVAGNGWITLAGGVLILLLVGLTALTGEGGFRWMSLVLALAVTGFAIYDLVRIIQAINSFSSSPFNALIKGASGSLNLHLDIAVGWGLIMLLIGAVGAVLFAVGDLRSSS